MNLLRKTYRSLLLAVLFFVGIILAIIFLPKNFSTTSFASTLIKIWHGLVLSICGIKLKVYGTPLATSTLFVANHISWLDISVIGHLMPVHFLAKQEVQSMPVVGWFADRAGTLYIKRGCKNSASEVGSEITNAINKKNNALVFAEGKTTDGNIRKFHSRLMQSAIDANAMVQPIAIFYPIKNSQTKQTEVNPKALFIGDTTMGESYDLVARANNIDVEVHFLKPIDSTGKTRDEISQHAFDEVLTAIQKIKNEN